MPLTVARDNVDTLLKNIRQLTRNEVYVGVPDKNADRQLKPDEKSAASNALIAYVMETGSPAKNIPARPFLVPGIENAKDKIVAQMKKGAEAVMKLDGPSDKSGAIDQAQNATGLIAVSAVKAKITSNIPPALSQRTLDARKARGVSRTNTLIDTGQLLNAQTYVPKGQ